MTKVNTSNNKNDQGVNIIDLLVYFASRWKWFLVSVIVFGGLAWLHYARSPRVYFRSATVIIKDPSNKTSTAGLDRYDNFINKVNVANEILQFRSKRLMREVVLRVHADVSYRCKDGLHYDELYTQAPVSVSFHDMLPEQSMSLTVTPADSVSVMVSGLDGEGEPRRVRLNDTVSVAQGSLVVSPTNYYSPKWKNVPVQVTKMPLESMVNYYRGAVGIRQEEEESSILTLSLKDSSPARAEDVLNMLIAVYNEEAIRDKNQVAVNTANFINERLIIIEGELGGVESDLESFKRENRIVDIGSTAGMYMSESQKYNADALELETQLRLAAYIKDYLTDPKKETDLIPSNTGIGDQNIEGQISLYNAAKLKRDRLIDDSSERNPVVEELNNSLRAMKQNIIRAVDNMIVSLKVKRDDAQSREERAQQRVTSIPSKERRMLSIERQQKIKEALYLFLLNRREENALSQAMADNNARVIDSADGSDAPIAPQRNRILLLGLLVGLAVPAVACLAIMFMDTRVRNRKDIEGAVNVPFLGEIPLDRNVQKQKNAKAVVSEHGDDMVSESFRILRTNLTFMARKDKGVQVITFTSFNEGAGKTFISRNLAMSLSYAKKRVVLVDLDIRKATLSHHFHTHSAGVTNYLADPAVTVDDIVRTQERFDIIGAGMSAPNPAELLMDRRLDELMAELRKRDLEKLYQDRKLNNMALVLNGVDPKRPGYGYGYGYGYGHYGYGYGYGKKKR